MFKGEYVMHLDQPIGWLFFFVALVGVWAVVRSLKKRQMFPLVFAGLTVVLFGWFGIATLIYGGIPS